MGLPRRARRQLSALHTARASSSTGVPSTMKGRTIAMSGRIMIMKGRSRQCAAFGKSSSGRDRPWYIDPLGEVFVPVHLYEVSHNLVFDAARTHSIKPSSAAIVRG